MGLFRSLGISLNLGLGISLNLGLDISLYLGLDLRLYIVSFNLNLSRGLSSRLNRAIALSSFLVLDQLVDLLLRWLVLPLSGGGDGSGLFTRLFEARDGGLGLLGDSLGSILQAPLIDELNLIFREGGLTTLSGFSLRSSTVRDLVIDQNLS